MSKKFLRIKYLMVFLVLIIFTLRFFVSFSNSDSSVVSLDKEKIYSLTGFISDEPLVKDFNQSFTFYTPDMDMKIRVQTDRYGEYVFGDELRIVGRLIPPRNFKSNGGRTFDYVHYLLKDDIYFEMKKPSIEKISQQKKWSVRGKLFSLKHSFLENIKRVLGEPHAALAGGLVVGEKNALGKKLLEEFRVVGLIHIIVLSGYNITIVADSIRRVLSFLPRVYGIILGGCGICAFGILVGGGATVMRSCIMAIIALTAEMFRRDYNVARALLIAGLIMLFENPLILLYDPSFQLSFLATLGLILLSSRFEKRLGFITERLGLRGLVASTCATQVFVSPYILYMMGQLSLIGMLVNILVLPIIPLTMLMVFLTGACGFISTTLSYIPGWIAHFLLSYELFIVNIFSHVPYASLEVPRFPFWVVLLCYTIYLLTLTKFPSTIFQLIFKKKSSI